MAEPKPKKGTYGSLFVDAYNDTNRANLDFSFELAMREAKTLEARKAAALKAYTALKKANDKNIFDMKHKIARLQYSINKDVNDRKRRIQNDIADAYNLENIGLTAVGETMTKKVGANVSTTRAVQEAITAIGGTGAGRSNFQRAIIGRNLIQLAEAAHLRGGRTAGSFPRRQLQIIIKSGLGLTDDLSKPIQDIEDAEFKRLSKGIGTTVKRGKIKVFEKVDTDGDGVPDTDKPVIDPRTGKQKEVLAPGETIASLTEEIRATEGRTTAAGSKVDVVDDKIKELFGENVDDMLGSEAIIERARDIYDRKFARLTPEQERTQEEYRLTSSMSKSAKANYKLLNSIADNDPYIDRLVSSSGAILPKANEKLPGYVKVANLIMIAKAKDPTKKANDIIKGIDMARSGLTPAEIQKGKALALTATLKRANPNFSPTPPLPQKTTQQKVAQAFLEAAETPKEQAKTQNMFGIDDNIFDIVEGKSDVSGVADSIGNEPQGENPVLKFFSELFEAGTPEAPKQETKPEQPQQQQQQTLEPVPLSEQNIPEEFKPAEPQGVSPELLESQGQAPELPLPKGTRLGETGTFYYVYDGVNEDGTPKINIFYKKGAKKDKPIDPNDKLMKAAQKRAKEKYEKALKEKK